MKNVFMLLLFLVEVTLSFSQKQYVPEPILSDIKKSAKEVLGKLPSTNELKTSIITSKDYTIIINLKKVCESVLTKSSMTIPELDVFDKQLKEALSPTVFLTFKNQDDANKNKNIKISLEGGAQPCPFNCSDEYNECLNENPDNAPLGPDGSPLLMCTIGQAICGLSCSLQIIRTPINSAPNAQAIKVEATIEKIYCRNVYDGKNDNTEEVYGKIEVLMGQVCYDGDAERHPPIEAVGKYLWELKPDQFIKMKKGQTKNINQKKSWKYSLPPNCGLLEGQTVVICRSDLNERDLPHDADDKLEEGCPGGKANHCCYNQVYLNQVLELGSKTFNFVHIHSSGGTELEVYFKVVVSSQPPIKGGSPDTNGNTKN